MATAKPASYPRWNTGGSNRTEPTSGKKDTGWVLNEAPASSFFNWLQHFGGLWDEWHNERMFDGGDAEDVILRAPVPAADAGSTTLGGTDGVGAGNAGGATNVLGGDPASGDAAGGAVNVTGGGGSGTGNGGAVSLTGGGGGSSGTGGSILAAAGVTTGSNGALAQFAGGSTVGTDLDGGDARIRPGAATGNGSADVVLQAVDGSQGAGATSRSPTEYLRCWGSAKQIITSRSLVMTATDATQAPGRFVGTTRPTAPVLGDFYVDGTTGRSYVYDGTRWEGVGSRRVATTTDSNSVSGTTVETAFNQKDTIPANFAQLTDLIELKAGGSGVWSSGTVDVRVRLGGEELLNFNYTPTGGFFWQLDCDIIIDVIGASGNVRSKGGMLFNGTGGINTKSQTENTTTHTSPIDFTASNDLEITAQWTSAAGGNSITMRNLFVDIR